MEFFTLIKNTEVLRLNHYGRFCVQRSKEISFFTILCSVSFGMFLSYNSYTDGFIFNNFCVQWFTYIGLLAGISSSWEINIYFLSQDPQKTRLSTI